VTQLFVKIPTERIGVLIGPEGTVKKSIQKQLSVNLEIDSEMGAVEISLNKDTSDPSYLFTAKDVVTAIGKGFAPERAFKLIRNDENIFSIIDLREIFGRSKSNISRIKGRIIGKSGKMRMFIEEMSESSVSIYGHTVAIIGNAENVEIAKGSIKLLINGSQYKTVYRYLQKKRNKLKKRALELWENSPLKP
jgi:ribosomal RNA assembly protein